MARILLRALAALSLSLLSIACQTVPYTNRTQLALHSESEMNQLGLQAFQQTLSESKTITTGPQFTMVKKVSDRIAAAAENPEPGMEKPGYQWQVALIDSPQINAWCLPGGKMGVYTGILPVTQDEAGLAVVMGHEVAHAIAQHGNERMSQGVLAQFGLTAADAFAGVAKMSPTARQGLMEILGAGTNVAIMLPFSRSHESEADHIGLILMAKAGYDPSEAPKFWERMAKMAGGGGTPEFLSTHPSHETRIKDLQGWIPEAMKYYKPGGTAPVAPVKGPQTPAGSAAPSGSVPKPKIPSGGGMSSF
ncbi:MAG: M48 family metallopeptidase [Planctomycetes bacterium]|nr:M48 family metallopeptidase [Planctomycetota bacterium]